MHSPYLSPRDTLQALTLARAPKIEGRLFSGTISLEHFSKKGPRREETCGRNFAESLLGGARGVTPDLRGWFMGAAAAGVRQRRLLERTRPESSEGEFRLPAHPKTVWRLTGRGSDYSFSG